MHTSENVGANPLVIPWKSQVEARVAARLPNATRKMDPVLTDSKHNNLLFEERSGAACSVAGARLGPVRTMHERPGSAGRVVVLLTDIQAKVRMPNGDSERDDRQSGGSPLDGWPIDASRHERRPEAVRHDPDRGQVSSSR